MTEVQPRRWWILISIGIFAFMSNLDSSIVNIAMPIMAKQLAIPMNQIEWVVSIYLIVVSALLLFFGKLGDMYGKIKVFRLGTVIFIIGSFLSGVQWTFSFFDGADHPRAGFRHTLSTWDHYATLALRAWLSQRAYWNVCSLGRWGPNRRVSFGASYIFDQRAAGNLCGDLGKFVLPKSTLYRIKKSIGWDSSHLPHYRFLLAITGQGWVFYKLSRRYVIACFLSGLFWSGKRHR